MKLRNISKTAGAAALLLGTSCAIATGNIQGNGGNVTYDGEYVLHTFTNRGTFALSAAITADILVVGGGGGGGSGRCGGGGGGGGGFVYRTGVSLTNGVYSIVVGAGGGGGVPTGSGNATVATNGGNSVAFEFVAHGGGHGAAAASNGSKGGSGGGGAPKYVTNVCGTYKGGAAYEGEGFSGGCSTNASSSGTDYHVHAWAGGGGGAGEKGGDGVTTGSTNGHAGKGGDGLPCSITGMEVYYAGGGGGGFADYSQPAKAGTVAGGLGGGGCGSGCKTASGSVPWPGTDGEDGFGGGGGGGGAFGSNFNAKGGNGGSGVVIVRYRRDIRDEFQTVSAEGARRRLNDGYCVYTFTSNGTFTVSGNSYVDVLVVGGGGGGGASRTGGAGGGAGGVVSTNEFLLFDGTYDNERQNFF